MAQPGRSILANVDRLNRYMDAHDLAAIAVRSGVNFTYLSGMDDAGDAGPAPRHCEHGAWLHGGVAAHRRTNHPV